MKTILYFLPIFFLFSCRNEEIPVPAHIAGGMLTNSVEMGADYRWQYFYDLQTNSIVGKNLKTDWDLGFETSDEGFHVILNSSVLMFAVNSNLTDFEQVTDTADFDKLKKWDEASGHLDSTAIGDWRTNKNVYFIDLGSNENWNHRGFRKFQILNYDAISYTIRFAEINGANDTVMTITKDKNCNFTFLSITSKKVVTIEPPKTQWDLVFTHYTHIFYDQPEPLPYLVTGCLLNRYETKAWQDSVTAFDSIHFNFAHNKLPLFQNSVNVIGYDWKVFTGSYYATRPQKIYLIQDQDHFLYKLHFIDFHNPQGVKGTPTWEYQPL